MMHVRPVPTVLVTRLRMYDATHEQVCRRGGDMAASRQNVSFSREQLSEWIASAEAMYPDPFTIEGA